MAVGLRCEGTDGRRDDVVGERGNLEPIAHVDQADSPDLPPLSDVGRKRDLAAGGDLHGGHGGAPYQCALIWSAWWRRTSQRTSGCTSGQRSSAASSRRPAAGPVVRTR